MAMVPKAWCGCGGLAAGDAQWASREEVAFLCGNALVLLDSRSRRQRLLLGRGHGILAFACCPRAGLLATVEQGSHRTTHVCVYGTADLEPLQRVHAGAGAAACTALALSADGELLAMCGSGPGARLAVWRWCTGEQLAAAAMGPCAARAVSFHPGDLSRLVTILAAPPPAGTDAGAAASAWLWRLDRLWARHELHGAPLELPPGCEPACHAWAPEGLYLGCSGGRIVCVDPETAAVVGSTQHPAVGQRPADARGLCVNRHAVAEASAGPAAAIAFYSRASRAASGGEGDHQQKQQQQQPSATVMRPLGKVAVDAQGCRGVAFGGLLHKQLAISTSDGRLLLLPCDGADGLPPDGGGEMAVLVEGHSGAVAGLAPAPGAAHMLSCGADGSVRLWSAADGGGVPVGRRELGGRLTCCSVAPAGRPLLAVGSEAGVLRLLAFSDAQRLAVVFRARLHRAPITALAFSPCGALLAAAAGAERQVALLRLPGGADGGGRPEPLGYFTAPEPVLALCWSNAGADGSARLLLSLEGGRLMAITPPAAAEQRQRQQLEVARGSVAGQQQQQQQQQQAERQQLQLDAADVHTAAVATEVPLLQIAAVNPAAAAGDSNGGGGQQQQQQQQPLLLLGVGADGLLHWLPVPAGDGGWERLGSGTLRSTAKLRLAAPAATLAMCPGDQQALVACRDGSVAVLPTQPPAAAIAAAALAAATAVAVEGEQLEDGSGAHTACALQAAGAGQVLAHGALQGAAASSLVAAWSADGQWAASGASDGSLLLHAAPGNTLASGPAPTCTPEPAQAKGAPQEEDQEVDQEVVDDAEEATLQDAAAAAAAAEAHEAGAAVRQATLQRLEELRAELATVKEANQALPPDHRLAEGELLVDVGRMAEAAAAINAEAAALRAAAQEETRATEAQARRIKEAFWDSMQTKGALCTGIKSGELRVANFPLPAQDEEAWAKVANLRRVEMAEAVAQGLPTVQGATGGLAGGCGPSDGQPAAGPSAPAALDVGPAPDSEAAAALAAAAGPGLPSPQPAAARGGEAAAALVARVCGCAAASLRAADLLYPEVEVTHPPRKLVQARLYARMVWELKSGFNGEFDALVQRKRHDADRLAELAGRMDELGRELVAVHSALHPGRAAAGADAAAGEGAGGQRPEPAGGGGAGAGDAELAALAAELAAGRPAVHWSPEEDMEDLLFTVKPSEIKAEPYLPPAERARAAAEAAEAAEAARRAAADDSAERALRQMMGGRLERATDEVAELAASRPAWMAGNPQDFTEEQLRQYREYGAREQAALEERVKRKAVMEVELRTLRAAAEEAAAAFDAALAALAGRRLGVQLEVTALEWRLLRLLADHEEATVTVGPRAEAAAAAGLAAALEEVAALDRELAETQRLLAQQQEALAAARAEERGADQGLRRELAGADPSCAARLTPLYRARLAPAGAARRGGGGAGGGTGEAAAAAAAAAAVPPEGSAELQFGGAVGAAAAGGGAGRVGKAAAGGGGGAAAAAAATVPPELRGPLGPPPMKLAPLADEQRPEGVDPGLWQRFLEHRATRARLEIAARQEAAKLGWLQRQQEVLAGRRAAAAARAAAASEAVEGLRTRRAAATFDVELQLRITQGQVESWPQGVASCAPDALLVPRERVASLNEAVLAKGEAKLAALRQLVDARRGLRQLEQEKARFEAEAQEVVAVTQRLQLLHVTKEFQQLVKGSSSSSGGNPSGAAAAGGAAAAARARGGKAAAGASAAATQSAASREVAGLENLLKVREQLHAKEVEARARQLRRLEAQAAAMQRDTESAKHQIAGLQELLGGLARLEAPAAAGDDGPARSLRLLAAQRKLRDVADAQAAEIAAAQAELEKLERRCFPFFPDAGGCGGGGGGGGDLCVAVPAAVAPAGGIVGGRAGPRGGGGGGSAHERAAALVAAGGAGFAPRGGRVAARAGAPRVPGPDTKLPAAAGTAVGPGRTAAGAGSLLPAAGRK